MARSKEFDKAQVIEQAMRLFWEKGYEATSMRDLQKATGISSSSMYEAFGDKRSLFLTTLERFCELERGQIAALAHQAASPQAFVEQLFIVTDSVDLSNPSLQGSLAFRAMVEFGTLDADITRLLLAHYMGIADIIAASIQRGQADHSVNPQADSRHLAYTILSTLHGVATLKGVKPDFALIPNIAQIILGLLKR